MRMRGFFFLPLPILRCIRSTYVQLDVMHLSPQTRPAGRLHPRDCRSHFCEALTSERRVRHSHSKTATTSCHEFHPGDVPLHAASRQSEFQIVAILREKPTMRPEPNALDVVPPDRIAQLVEDVGVKKVKLAIIQTLTLGILAGAFIAFGGMFYTIAITGSALGLGPTRLLGGLAFSLGLILVVIGGAELFTGNSLIVMAWADRRVGTAALLRNWALVYFGNLIGAFAMAVLVHLSGVLALGDGPVGATAEAIAQTKVALLPGRPSFEASFATCWSASRSGCVSRPRQPQARSLRSCFRSRRSWHWVSSIPSPTCT